MRNGTVRGLVLAGAVVAILPALAGCDYWPPALQSQIEQLQAEAQSALAERAKRQGQVADVTKRKDELQARVDDLARSNRDLTGKLAGLEQALVAEKEKAAHLAKAAFKPAAKPVAAKTASKPPVKKVDKKKTAQAATKKRA